LKQIKKAIYEREFFKTIERPDKAFEPLDVSQMEVGSEYDGPVFDSINT
jgi:serine/threonine-protein phosphatase 5